MVIVEPSVEISDRIDFCLLSNARGHRYAVEVGVEQGIFTKQFLDRWAGEYMHLIDAYEPHEESPGDRLPDIVATVVALRDHHGRYKMIRGRSPEIARQVWWKIAPDFVYLDADHGYESVRDEILHWWPRLSERGILAGHDYDEAHPGVIQAVNEFAEREGVIVRLTSEPDFPHSWYAYKVEPPTLIRQFFAKGEIENPHSAT